jgi:hypothetical protein
LAVLRAGDELIAAGQASTAAEGLDGMVWESLDGLHWFHEPFVDTRNLAMGSDQSINSLTRLASGDLLAIGVSEAAPADPSTRWLGTIGQH